MSRIRATVPLCLGLLALAVPLWAADHALVQAKSNLRHDPSTSHTPIRVVLPNEEVTVVDAQSNQRYIQVTTENNETGWILRKNVSILPDPDGPNATAVTIPPPSTGGIPPNWDKPNPVDVEFNGSEGPCSGTGDGGDSATNARKNRNDALPAPHDVVWSAIASLTYPAAPPSRAEWTAGQLASISPFEGVALRTVGYLTHSINIENTGSGESTNCHFHEDADVDWHIYLQEKSGDPISKAVVVETTPRVRMGHKWNAATLNKWVGKNQPVRISGFLMLDPEHRNQVGQYRGTVWELHPVTNIEVCNKSACGSTDWVALDKAK